MSISSLSSPSRARRAAFVSILMIFFGFVLALPGSTQPSSVFGSPEPGRLSLHVGDLRTEELENFLQTPPDRFSSTSRYLVQLDGPITPAKREDLEGMGVVLEEYIPHYAYVARLGRVQPRDITAAPFLQWVGSFETSWKIEGSIGQRTFASEERQEMIEDGQVAVIVTLFRGVPASVVLDQLEVLNLGDLLVHRIAPLAGNVTISLSMRLENLELFSDIEEVQFVEEAPEITLRNSTNRWVVQSNQTNVTPLYDNGIHGEGQVVGIMDGRIDVDHCSFSDSQPIGPNHRKILAYNTAQGTDVHGTHVGGTAAGDSGASDNNRGVAYLSKIVFHDVPAFTETAMHSRLSLHHGQGARIHTNSWGDDGTTNYNSLSRGIDSFSYDFEDSLVMFAVTNTSSLKNPENAKNSLAVGASQDSPNQGNFCSGGAGPSVDGRRKPEIFAPGCSTNSSSAGTSCGTTSLTGTSMASPAVAGTSCLIRQYYVDGYYPTGSPNGPDSITPSGALIKATALNASVDMTGITGYPSNQEGWGRITADRSLFFSGDTRKLEVLDDIRNASGLSTAETNEYSVEVLGSTEKLQITLAFTDAPASAGTGSGQAAVNDLDLEVVSPTGDLFLGNFFLNGISSTGGTKDVRNNVEQVHVSSPAPGFWTIRVKAAAVNQGTQGYSLIATGDIVQQLPPLRVVLPNGAPQRVSPGETVDVDVTVAAGTENVVPGSPNLHFRLNSAASFQSTALTSLGGDDYRVSLPASDCGDAPEFYFSAQGDGGTTIFNPGNAPSSTYLAEVGEIASLFADDFETDQGWTIENGNILAGAWERGIPSGDGTRGDPVVDADGSGRCYVTQNGAGDTDVDEGPTRLVSPVMDLESTNATVSWSRWFSNDDGDDDLIAQISDDGGSTWIQLESVTGGSGGWVETSHLINDFITPTSTVRFRFIVADVPNNSVTEAGIDAFHIEELGCIPAGDNPDLEVSNIQVDYDPLDGDVDAGPGGVGQAINVLVTIRNRGNVPILTAHVSLDANVTNGSTLKMSQVLTDFDPAPGIQSLAPGVSSVVLFSYTTGQLDRCGTYTLVASHTPNNLQSMGMSGPIFGDRDTGNNQRMDHPDTEANPEDDFSPDLLELSFGTFAVSIQAVSEIIEDRATEKVRVDLDYTGLGPGMDSHDIRLLVDLVDDEGIPAYLGVLIRSKDGVRSNGSRSFVFKLAVSGLTPTPPPNAEYRVRFRLRDVNSSEICIEATTPNTTTLQ